MTELPPGLGAPAHRALAAAGIDRLGHLTAWTEAAVADLHGVGPKAMRLLVEAMADHGLRFSTQAGDVPARGSGPTPGSRHT